MWQRFTEMARKVVFDAQEEAQKLGEREVDTEHLLLGLARDSDTVACRILEKLGVSLKRIRVEVEKQVVPGDATPSKTMTLTPHAKRVVELAYDEARALGNNYIGTEHLLLGLVREGEGVAGRVLGKLGIELERARREVEFLQSRPGPSGPSEGPVDPTFKTSDLEPYAWSAYDAEARSALYRAKAQANEWGETHLTPLHLVLALLADEDSGAVRALRAAGLDPSRLRGKVERHRTWAEGAPEELQLSPNGRKTMDAATVEAQELGSERLGSEHILLGLARGNRDGVGRVLTELGLDLRRLREAVKGLPSGERDGPGSEDASESA